MSKAVFNLKKERQKALTIAHELCYNEVTIGKILDARTAYEINSAMRYGRHKGGRAKNDCIGRI